MPIAPRVLLVTDSRYADAQTLRVVREVGDALPRGAFGVQLRDNARSRDLVRGLAERLRVVTRVSGALFVVNGDVALAVDVGADGVHLGGGAPAFAVARDAFPNGWVSVAAHSDADVVRALDDRADAVLVSPIFETPGKGPPRGLHALERAAALADPHRLAVYALGGVDASRASACLAAGAHGVAVIRALLDATDPGAAARAILDPETRDPPARLD